MNSFRKYKKQCLAGIILVVCMVMAACSEMFDNVKDFADKEIVYADKLDGIVRTQIGYERVEIDLMQANLSSSGRIPSSKLNMGKAKKTVIECADFTEPEHRRVIDSVCSWLDITGLTQSKNYQITIYTEDEFGNRSLPLKTEVKPFTVENLNALQLSTPSITESSSAARVEWLTPISSKACKIYSYVYEYIDKDGQKRTEGSEGDLPSFFVQNIEKGKEIPITMTFRIIPTLLGDDGVYTPILDTLRWECPVLLTLSTDAKSVIFLDVPTASATLRVSDLPLTFRWIPVSEVSQYTLKLSNSPSFPNNTSTVSIPVGNTDSYTLSAGEAQSFFGNLFSSPFKGSVPFYWTVEPNVSSVSTQTRRFIIVLPPHVISAETQSVIDFRDFDLGGNGVAYSASDGYDGGTSNYYRTDNGDFNSPGVDMWTDGGGLLVHWQEWFIYSVFVETAGNYTIDFWAATANSGDCSVSFNVDGGSEINVPIPNTGWNWWMIYGSITLPAGEHKIRFLSNSVFLTVTKMTFTKQ